MPKLEWTEDEIRHEAEALFERTESKTSQDRIEACLLGMQVFEEIADNVPAECVPSEKFGALLLMRWILQNEIEEIDKQLHELGVKRRSGVHTLEIPE